MTDKYATATATAAVPMTILSAPANCHHHGGDPPARRSLQSPARPRPSWIPVIRVTPPTPRAAHPHPRQPSSRIPVSSTGPPPRVRPNTTRQTPARQQGSIPKPGPQPVLPSSPSPPHTPPSSTDRAPTAESEPAARANERDHRHGFICACKRTLRSMACW